MVERDKNGRLLPGQPGLPGAGRPKGSISLISELKKQLSTIDVDSKKTLAQEFAERIIEDAMNSDGPSRKLVMNYIEGLPMQKTETTHILNPIPLDNVSQNKRLQADKDNDEKNQSSARRNISEQDSEYSAVFDSEVSM